MWFKCVPVIVLASAVLLELCKGECQQAEDYPVFVDDGEYLCGIQYPDEGGEALVDGCNGVGYDLVNGGNYSTRPGSYFRMGSLIVKHGCILYGYKSFNYDGESQMKVGPLVDTNGDGFDPNPIPGYGSMQCRCSMAPVDCDPLESYLNVLTCEGSAEIPKECSYNKVIGTTFSEDLLASMAIDASIEVAIKEKFFQNLGETLGQSQTTGYDWSVISAIAKGEPQTFTNVGIAPPGFILKIDQVIATCGSQQVNTELFKMSYSEA